MVDPSPFVDALARAGYRLTAPRRGVAELIAARQGHFTAAELVDDARGRHLSIGRATVFRTLEVLATLGAIERLDLPTGEHAYVGCEPAHHHHVVCSRCGRTAEIDDTGVRTVVSEIGRRTGFRVDDHRLEAFGLCPACQADVAAPAARRPVHTSAGA
jgi:Fur family ferric uptake transcriptional regulator